MIFNNITDETGSAISELDMGPFLLIPSNPIQSVNL